MNSITKWIGGHGIAIGGVIVDGGKFDWNASGKFPVLTEPYAGYHGIVFAEQFGPSAFIMRARTEGLRDFGACLSPTNAFQLLQGVETLAMRMERHMANTHAVLAFLTKNPAVDWVLHPSLETHPDYALAKRLLPRGAGSIVSFGIKGGRAAGKKFIEALRLASHLANVGDAKTLVIHPASTTHQQMDAAQLKAAGVGEELVRLSVGIEGAEDIIDDLGQALRASQTGVTMRLNVDGTDAFVATGGARLRRGPAGGGASAWRAAWTIRSGRCTAAGSRITATRCWRRTCPATGGRRARRSRPSPPWLTGSRR